MSDNPIDLSDWLPLEHDVLHLPPNISDSSLLNPFMDYDQDNLPQKQIPLSTVTDHLPPPSSPSHTHIEPVPTTPDTYTPTTPIRPPLAHLSTNPLRLAPTKTLKKASLNNNKSARNTPRRTPPVRAKPEHPLVSPLPSNHKSPAKQRPQDDSRERHNQMMRENRYRFNNKFKELTLLLDSFKEPAVHYKPMKNKIQILERAIYQYARMQTRRARFESELMFSPEHPDNGNPDFLRFFLTVPSLRDACNLALQNMCGTMDWKYAEAWIRPPQQHARVESSAELYELAAAVVSKNNMPDTRRLLEQFSEKAKPASMDPYLLKLSQHRHAVWIPDLRAKTTQSARAGDAKEAGITTMVTVPIFLGNDALPDAIITLMHVNDELLSYAKDERPYDSPTMTRLLDLVTAVVKSRAKIAC